MQGWKRSGALVLAATMLVLAMLQASGVGCSAAPEPVSADTPARTKPPNAPTAASTPGSKSGAEPVNPSATGAPDKLPDQGIMMGASKAPVFVRPKPTTSSAPVPQAPNAPTPAK